MIFSGYDDPLGNILLSNEDILERVDEYSLYCHYLGYEPVPGTGKYRSPVRTNDDDPSFGIFYTTKNPNREFLWKDQANGQVGDIFRLVQYMFGYRTVDEARRKIIQDLGMGEKTVEDRTQLVYHPVPKSFITDIRVASRMFTQPELKWWADINIGPSLLERYYTTALRFYWLAQEQEVPYNAKEFTFAYRIFDKYKIYQPFAPKEFKFRHNLTDQHIEGLEQLEFKQDLLVIIKSLKDVMFLKSIGYESIAPRSENTLINPGVLRALEGRYKRIVTFFDNDGKHKASEYPYPRVEIPSWASYKDPTDVARYTGIGVATAIVNQLLDPYR